MNPRLHVLLCVSFLISLTSIAAIAQKTEPAVKAGATRGFPSVAFSPNGKILASGSSDGLVMLWNLADGSVSRTLRAGGNRVWVYSVAISPDGKTLASGSLNSDRQEQIKLWDIGTGKEPKTLTWEDVPDVYSVVFSPDSKTLATCGLYKGIRLWDVASGKPLYTVLGQSPSFSPDGKTLAGGLDSKRGSEFKLWDAATGTEIHSFKGYSGSDYPLQYVTFSPNGKILAGNIKEGVTFFDVSTGKQLYTIKGKPPITFSVNGKILATAIRRDYTIRLWDVATGKEIRLLKGHSHGVSSMAFSRDGKTLASSSESEKRIVLWDVKTGKERRVLTEP